MEGMHEYDVEPALTAVEIYTLEKGDYIRIADTMYEVTHIREGANVNILLFELCEATVTPDGECEPKDDGEVIYRFAHQLIGKAH